MSLSISYFSLTSGIVADFCHLQGQENANISTLTGYSKHYCNDFYMGWMASISSQVSDTDKITAMKKSILKSTKLETSIKMILLVNERNNFGTEHFKCKQVRKMALYFVTDSID